MFIFLAGKFSKDKSDWLMSFFILISLADWLLSASKINKNVKSANHLFELGHFKNMAWFEIIFHLLHWPLSSAKIKSYAGPNH